MKWWIFPLITLMSCLPSKGPLQYSLPHEADPVIIQPTEDVSFARISREILIPKCLECHKKIADESWSLKRLTPGQPEKSKLFLSVESGKMPKDAPPLSTKELELLRGYINSLLAPEN